VRAGQEQIPQALRAGPRLELLHQRRRAVARHGAHLLVIALLVGQDMLAHELADPALQIDRTGAVLEVHGGLSEGKAPRAA
jgi:hypothetical protein